MVEFGNISVGDIVYIIDDNPITILELKILSFGYDEENNKILRVANTDLSFEVDFDKIKENMFYDQDTALANATKLVFKETNKFIEELTDGYINDYFELDNLINKYKESHPELFI
jgi:hypothetical protein